eukprot:362520-Chlamydomonas_euryale.AAC.10
MDGWMYGRMDGWMYGRMDGWMDGWMDEWIDKRIDEWMDKRTDGCMYENAENAYFLENELSGHTLGLPPSQTTTRFPSSPNVWTPVPQDLQYLNLAINNVTKLENLQKCESLEKLDLTMNFVPKAGLMTVASLEANEHLKVWGMDV